jgi:hypothetical protein
VLAEQRRLDDGGLQALLEQRLQDVDDPGHQRAREAVAGGRADPAVELAVQFAEAVGVRAGRLGLGDELPEPADVLLVRALGGEPRERDLHQHPRLEQLVEVDGVGGEHRGDGVADAERDALLGGRGDEDATARALRRADEVGAREQAQRLAQRRAADPETAREVLLAAEPIARLQVLVPHERADVARHLLAGAAAGCGCPLRHVRQFTPAASRCSSRPATWPSPSSS